MAGVDEAGRGPLAGPVVAAAVALPFPVRLRRLERGDVLTDSKCVPPDRRERLFDAILDAATHVGWAAVGPSLIDRMNILEAARHAMRLALLDLSRPPRSALPDVALVDGLTVPHLPCAQEAVVGGDGKELVIAAASIVAKVVRDRMMHVYDGLYPGYAFADHKGYYAPAHLAALDAHGPCPVHRMSFSPVRVRALPRSSPGEGSNVGHGPSSSRSERTGRGESGRDFPDPVGI